MTDIGKREEGWEIEPLEEPGPGTGFPAENEDPVPVIPPAERESVST